MTPVLRHVIPGLTYTIVLTLFALVLGMLLGLLLAWARSSESWIVRAPVVGLVDLVRAIPPITWLFILFFGLSNLGLTLSSIVAAIVGLSLIAAVYLSEIYRAGLLSIDRGQWDAARALGLPETVILRKVVAPQAAKVVLPAGSTYAIGLIKDTSITSTIGVAELTLRATDYQQRTGHGLLAFAFAGVLYLALSLVLAGIARGFDRRSRAGVSMR